MNNYHIYFRYKLEFEIIEFLFDIIFKMKSLILDFFILYIKKSLQMKILL